MNVKTINHIIRITAAIIGGLVGYFYPNLAQVIIAPIGLGAGIVYFFGSNSVNKNPEEKTITDFSPYAWFKVMQAMMGFLVGAALTSTIVLIKDII